jgi:hypothetical protein
MPIGFPAYAEAEERYPGHDPRDIIRLAERILDDLGWHISGGGDDWIKVRTATGIWFFGDQMTVDVSPRGTVHVRSQCIIPTQIFDLGRNQQHVDRFLDRLDRRLRKIERRREEGDDERR